LPPVDSSSPPQEYIFHSSVLFFVFLPILTTFEADREPLLIGSAVLEGRLTPRTTTQSPIPRQLVSAQEKIMQNPPLGATFVVNSEPTLGHVNRPVCVWG
jgi:hypothetical protein